MIDLALARVLHVLAVVLWIGGVAMVTLVLIPNVLRDNGTPAQFEAFERRFATQSRITVLLAGVSSNRCGCIVGSINAPLRILQQRCGSSKGRTACY